MYNENKINTINSILILFMISYLSFNLIYRYRMGTLTPLFLVIPSIVFCFFVYFLIKKKKWVYKLTIILSVLSIAIGIYRYSLPYLFTFNTLFSLIEIGLAKYAITLLEDKKGFKLPFF